MKLSFFTLVFSVMTLLVCSCQEDDRSDAAPELIKAFGNACASNGPWSEIARSQNQSLITTLETLKNNDRCKNLHATLNNLQGIGRSIHGVMEDKAFMNYRMQEEQLQELTLALAKTDNPELQLILKDALFETQLELVRARAENTVADQFRNDEIGSNDIYSIATSELGSQFQNLMEQAGSLSECLKQSPSASIQLATNLISMGGSFVSPLFGATSYVVGNMINFGVEMSRHQPITDAVWDLYKIQLPSAMTCGLEAMTTFYCQANDAEELIQRQVSGRVDQSGPSHPIWEGIDILSNKLPILNRWLLKVKNGVIPNNPDDADRVNRVLDKVNDLERKNNSVVGELSQSKVYYDRASGQTDLQYSILKRTTTNIIQILFMRTNPEVGTFDEYASSRDFVCWLLLGNSTTNCPPKTDANSDFRVYIDDVRATVSGTLAFEVLEKNWPAILSNVKKVVDIEFTETISIDPSSVVTEAFEPTLGNLSPREALDVIVDFLEKFKTRSIGRNRRIELIDESLKLLKSAIKNLDSTSKTNTQILAALFEQFRLKTGIQFFSQRMGNFVEWDLTDRTLAGDVPTEISEILYEAGTNISSRLMASGVRNLDNVLLDLHQARNMTEGNIKVFRSYFEPLIAKSMTALEEAAKSSGEKKDDGLRRVNGQLLGRLCTLVLASGMSWPAHIPFQVCQNSFVDSLYAEKGVKIEFRKLFAELYGAPFKERVCAYHRFQRAGRLAEAETRRRRSTLPLSSPFAPSFWETWTYDLLK